MKVELVNSLTVGPDEVLIITVPDDSSWDQQVISDLIDHLKSVGQHDRALVFQGDVSLSKVSR
jgi:electron transfer flavoprotein alpha/beta subunit